MNSKFWDRLAPNFDKKNSVNQQLMSILIANISKKDRVLEIGTGTGDIAIEIANHCFFIKATDFSKEMIRRATLKSYPNNLSFSVEDGTHLNYANESFDVVLTVNTLHVVPKINKMLKEINRVLKPGGFFLAVVPISKQSKLKAFITRLFMRIMKFHFWGVEKYIQVLKKNSYKVIDYKEVNESGDTLIFITQKL